MFKIIPCLLPHSSKLILTIQAKIRYMILLPQKTVSLWNWRDLEWMPLLFCSTVQDPSEKGKQDSHFYVEILSLHHFLCRDSSIYRWLVKQTPKLHSSWNQLQLEKVWNTINIMTLFYVFSKIIKNQMFFINIFQDYINAFWPQVRLCKLSSSYSVSAHPSACRR